MSRIRTRVSDERGTAMILTVLSMSLLLGFMALAIDTGMLFQAKRRLQVAADAAAVAGTLDYLYNASTSSAYAAAQGASTLNGYTDGSNGVTVAVSDPPTDGPNKGNTAYFEATVTQQFHTMFLGLFGHSTMPVKARAVAGVPTNGQACIWVMATTGGALTLQGAYDIEATGCGIYVNSPSSTAFVDTGNGGVVNAKFLDVVGNSPPAHQTTPTATTVNTAPRKNPWGDISGPTPTNGGCTTTSSATSITGTYNGPGLGSAVCFTQAVTLNNATLGAGTYMFENGVNLSGTVTVNGGTLDIYSGTFSQGNAVLNITAPTAGPYNGLAIMQPSSNTTGTCGSNAVSVPCIQVQFGSSNQRLDGYIYAPTSQVFLQDNGGGTTASGIVAGTFYDKASKVTIPSYDVAHPSTTPNRVVTLVE